MKFNVVKKDLIAGFIVSLIALPLCLGLALASNVPPMAGIISAVVGGFLVALFGGSHVSITGPGNGLVVVILTAVVGLGGEDLYQGYIYTLAAVVVSGGILFLMGLLKFGKLGDFFPSAAVQGMLSAIGIIILAKQAHIMLGNLDIEAANNAEMLLKVPQTIIALFSKPSWIAPAIVGVLSLLILVYYPKMRNKVVQLVPAPMWILLLCIGLYEYYGIFNPGGYPIADKFLLPLPDDLSSALVFPDFGKVNTGVFWEAVIGITLIASIESLLSIKAIDRLDPKARRSNVNKDLRALGVSTALSGLLGGLPVVTVIARSSVNVNSGAQSRKSNMFMALFLLIMLVGLQGLLKKIPMPALAAILVYTGYKLAEPKVFKNMWRLGKEQFFIFLATVVSTLFLGLINGIVIGIGLTLLLQVIQIRPLRLFFRYLFWPNTLMYEEEDNKFILNVKGVSNFINFPRLKYKIESVPTGSSMILDFSLCNYIDESVLEQIGVFESEIERRGGRLEVIGLDQQTNQGGVKIKTGSRLKASEALVASQSLTKRQQGLKTIAADLEWSYKTRPFFEVSRVQSFPYFQTKRIDFAYNTIWGEMHGFKLKVRDLEYFEGEFIAKEVIRATMMVIEMKGQVPKFSLEKENIFSRLITTTEMKPIRFAKHPDFSKRFALRAHSKDAVKDFFNAKTIKFFEFHPSYHLESNGKDLLIFNAERLATPTELKQMIQFADDLLKMLNE